MGGGWNYRVVRTKHRRGKWHTYSTWAVHEVYYDDQGKPEAMTEGEVSPFGETAKEFRRSLAHYQEGIQKPVLTYPDDFPEGR